MMNLEYVKIAFSPKSESFSYGGNQNWFYNRTDCTKNSDACIRRKESGCGLIAASDFFLYLESMGRIPNCSHIHKENGEIDQKEYYDYVVQMDERGYFSPTIIPAFLSRGAKSWGIPLYKFKSGIRKYSKEKSLGLQLKSLSFATHPKKKMIHIITEQLKADIPVPLYIGLFGGAKFYDVKRCVLLKKPTRYHYVMITGIKEISPGIYELTVSSWGQKYNISYAELAKNVDSYIVRIW